jgi:hypothetical protein
LIWLYVLSLQASESGSLDYNLNISPFLIVSNCRTKTTPGVKKKDLLKAQTTVLPLLGSECSSLAGMGRGLYRRSYMVKEGERSSQRTARLLASIYL